MNMLEIKKLNITADKKEIITDLNLNMKRGEIAVMMGPNGSGKSTLANTLMGHPHYKTKGTIKLEGKPVQNLSPDKRSKAGIFLSFQYPITIPGVTVSNFLRQALNARRPKNKPLKITEYVKLLNEKIKLLHIKKEFTSRYLNEGFSGGEKKKLEMLQLAMLEPKLAILDETDSGLDIDALKNVCEAINTLKKNKPDTTFLIITHYQRMLNYIIPTTIYILLNGKIIKKGGPELAKELERKGYEEFKTK